MHVGVGLALVPPLRSHVGFTRFGVDFEVFLAVDPGVRVLGGMTCSCLKLLGVSLSPAPV